LNCCFEWSKLFWPKSFPTKVFSQNFFGQNEKKYNNRPGCVCEKATQNGAQSMSCKNEYTTFTVDASNPMICAISGTITKTTQS
jgi:hypothetical protein